MFGKLNIVPFVYPYGGSACDVFSKANFERVMAIYARFLAYALSIANKTMVCSGEGGL